MRMELIKKLGKTHPGFSLLELMVVLVIMAILATFVGVAVFGQLEEAKKSATQAQMAEFGKTLDLYRLRNGKFPSNAEGLEALVNPPRGAQLLRSLPKDPWDNAYFYVYPPEHNRSIPDIFSAGPDRIEGTEDDIGNWPDEGED